MASRRNSLGRLRQNARAIQRAAFTLVELMIVVVIAIILMAVTLPTIKYSIEEAKVREGARQINAFFASAKAQATATALPAGVWLELEQIGDPTLLPGNRLYQCSQLYLAEVPAPYGGDIQNARCYVSNNAVPWQLTFTPAGCEASLQTLVADTEKFFIRFDYKGPYFLAQRSGTNYIVIDTTHVPPKSNGTVGYAFQVFRQPQRVGQPLELPQGVVIDTAYSGLGRGETDAAGNILYGVEFHASAQVVGATGRGLVILFNPQGGVSQVSPVVDPVSGNVYDNQDLTKVHLLVGRTEKVDYPFNSNWAASNIADGSNMWVTVNRRNGSVATVENVPDANLPMTAPVPAVLEQAAFLARAREFAAKSDVKGGQ